MRALVVLPTYNEAENVLLALAAILASPLEPDVLVVDDNSPDGTAELVRQAASDAPGRILLLSRPGKGGLGAAYRAGFAHALTLDYDVIVQMDADGSHPVSALLAMADRIAEGADVVIGSRYVAGGALSNDWPWYRRAMSRAGNGYARTALRLPVQDLTGGYKMWRTATLAGVDMTAAGAAGYGFQIQMTLGAFLNSAVVAEVPILFSDRERGESKMCGKIVLEATRSVWQMREQASTVRTRRVSRNHLLAGSSVGGSIARLERS